MGIGSGCGTSQMSRPWKQACSELAARMQWATFVVIEQMQRWRCPSYTPRTTIIAPYSSTEVVHALPEAEKSTLLFFRYRYEGPPQAPLPLQRWPVSAHRGALHAEPRVQGQERLP